MGKVKYNAQFIGMLSNQAIENKERIAKILETRSGGKWRPKDNEIYKRLIDQILQDTHPSRLVDKIIKHHNLELRKTILKLENGNDKNN